MPDQFRASFERKTKSFKAGQITWLNEQGITIKEACRALDMAQSTYFEYKHGSTKTEIMDTLILSAIRAINAYTNSLYGYRKMTLAIQKYFHLPVTVGSVRRVMRVHNLQSNYHKKKRKTSSKSPSEVVVANLMERDFEAKEPLMKWCSDVTDKKVNGKAYHICFIIDLYCNFIVGWAISEHNDANLVIAALQSAFRYGKPRKFLHTDQGTNYASRIVQDFLKENGVPSSMSRPGTPLDNAVCESINSVFKELYNVLAKPAHNKKELVRNVSRIVGFYHKDLVTERFGIRSIQEIYNVNLEILKARENGEYKGEIEFFPIKFNAKIGKFWSKVLECPLWQIRDNYKGMLRQYKAWKEEDKKKAGKSKK